MKDEDLTLERLLVLSRQVWPFSSIDILLRDNCCFVWDRGEDQCLLAAGDAARCERALRAMLAPDTQWERRRADHAEHALRVVKDEVARWGSRWRDKLPMEALIQLVEAIECKGDLKR